MSFELNIKMTPDADAAAARVAGFPDRMMRALVPVINLQHDLTIGHIQTTRLSQRGPDTLGVRSNRLRGSMRKAEARLSGLAIYSGIGSNVRYLGVHEFGFSGTVTVKAHQRRFANVEGEFLWSRRAISLREAAQLGRTKQKKIDMDLRTGVSNVKQHTRRMEFPARAPVRRGIEDRLPAYREAMSAAVVAEWQKGAS